MDQNEAKAQQNPLESEPIGKLILKYSIPAIISSLVGSIYNIVDQIFIGNSIGELGNAATNVTFPLVMIITTLAMTFGVGGASASACIWAVETRKRRLGGGNVDGDVDFFGRCRRRAFRVFPHLAADSFRRAWANAGIHRQVHRYRRPRSAICHA